jgi:hypothetical protein
MSETGINPPLQVAIVGHDADRFYAQKGNEPTLYVLPKTAFVTEGRALLVGEQGEVAVWLPTPHHAPPNLYGVTSVRIVGLTEREDRRRCEGLDCSGCRNHECVEYTGPQGRHYPTWHTLSTRGPVAAAWTL